MADTQSVIKERIYKLIPLNWKESKRRMVMGLIDIGFNEGRNYQLKECTNHIIKEGKDADSK